jgi:hypothetical protein
MNTLNTLGIIKRLQEKDRGNIIHWYETVKEVKTTKIGRIVKYYSIYPDNLNPEGYKEFLLPKLIDTLTLAGFRLSELDYSIPHIAS